MKILNKVTVTGAGDGIDPKDLWSIQEEYPFVEFGILLSRKASTGSGSVRFPSRSWLKGLVSQSNKQGSRLHLSGHLCGEWVRGFLTGHFLDFDSQITPGLGELFQRFQINTHAEPHEHSVELYDLLQHLANGNQSVIFQLDENDGSRIAAEVVSNGWKNVAGLFDLSHGAGVLPEDWPKPLLNLHCGYAGGLSPENVASQLKHIEQLSAYTWIDAETHLFQNGRFDLSRVRSFLDAAKPWAHHP